MNSIQWAGGEDPSVKNNFQDLVKLKPFADNTKALEAATADSITANNRITKQIIKNIDTGAQQRTESLKFFTELAPKAMGEIYGGVKEFRKARDGMQQVYDSQERLKNEVESAVELKGIIAPRAQKISSILKSQGDKPGALAALDIDGSATRGELIEQYWEKVRPNIYKQAGDIEFKIDGQLYTLNSRPPSNIAFEIRKRIDASIAAHALTTGVFGKREVITGILYKGLEENKKQLALDIAEEDAQNTKELVEENNKLLIQTITTNGVNRIPGGFSELLSNIEIEIQGAKDREEEYVPLTEQVEGLIKKMYTMAEMDLVDVNDVLFFLENSGEIKWKGRTDKSTGQAKIYNSVIEGFDENHAGLGTQWIDKFEALKTTKLANKDTARRTAHNNFGARLIADLKGVKDDQEYQNILNRYSEELEETDGLAMEYLPEGVQKYLKNPSYNLNKVRETELLIEELRSQGKPVPQSLMDSVPGYVHKRLSDKHGGRVFSSNDSISIDTAAISSGLLRPRIVDIVTSGPFKTGLSKAQIKKNILDEYDNLVMLEYNELIKENTHADALSGAIKIVDSKFKPLIDNAIDNKPGAVDLLIGRFNALAADGILGIDEPISRTALVRLMEEKSKFINNVVSKNDQASNVNLLSSEEFLIGEKRKELDQLTSWIENQGLGELPNYYHSIARKANIPVEYVALMRAEALDYNLGKNDRKAWSENIKNTLEKVKERSPLSVKLMNAESVVQKNLITLSQITDKDDQFFIEQQFEPAKTFDTNNENLTAYDYIERTDSKYDSEQPLSKMKVADIGKMFDKEGANYFNIGAYGIPNETQFKIIAKRLFDEGLINVDTVFDDKTQKLFYQHAALLKAQRMNDLSGIKHDLNTISEDKLQSCGIGKDKQAYPLTDAICQYVYNNKKN